MGYEVSLVGIAFEALSLDGQVVKPRVVAIEEEMGFSGLVRSLECFGGQLNHLNPQTGEVEILKEVRPLKSGVRQWLVDYPIAFCRHVRENPELWDSVGSGFEAGIKMIEEHPSYTWWFHARH